MNTIDELSEVEQTKVKHTLAGLIRVLKSKKGLASKGTLLSEEESILGTLIHPERGDLMLKLLREKKEIHVFINNPRDPNTFFSIMSNEDARKNTGRRMIGGNSGTEHEEDGSSLYLINAHDRDALIDPRSEVISLYTNVFGLSETPVREVSAEETLKNKPYENCTFSEKWIIYKKDWEMDRRRTSIAVELFQCELSYARFKQPVKSERIMLSPEKYRESVGQISRDIYPVNVQMVLKKDFPVDHKKKAAEVAEVLLSLKKRVDEKMKTEGAHSDYINHMNAVTIFIEQHISALSQ